MKFLMAIYSGLSTIPHTGGVYSVIQSYGNSFGVDVVLDSINMAYFDDDIILNHIYEKQIFSNLYDEDFEY